MAFVLTFLIRRLAQGVAIVLLVTFLIFTLLRVIPGDPVRIMLGPSTTQAVVEARAQELGLRDSIPEQFVRYIAKAVQGDFGESYFIGETGIALTVQNVAGGKGQDTATEQREAKMTRAGVLKVIGDGLPYTLVLEPRLLILDETLSALDQVEQSRLLEIFDKLQAEHGFTYIFISHDLAMVRRACTRIAVMYLGKIVELADNHTVFFDPGHPYIKALLSAVPTIEDRRYDAAENLLEGEPPSPIGIPPGCSFNSRCPLAFERCTTDEPGLESRGDGRISACYWANASEAELTAAAEENRARRAALEA